MIKSIGTLAAGVALGAGAVLVVQLVLYEDPAPAPQSLVTSPQLPLPVGTDPSTSEPVSLAQIQDLPEGFEQDAAVHDLLRGADAKRVEALLEEAAALDMGRIKWTAYRRYVELAPRAALDYMLSNDTNAQPLITWAVLSWGRRELDAALAFAETLAEPLRTESARSILNGIQELSDERKDEIARRFSLEAQLSQARVFAEAATNPEAAWRRALSLEPGQSRNQALWHVSQRWFGLDPAAALSALDGVPDLGQRETWRRRLLPQWASTDGEAALEWAASRPPSEERSSLIAEVAGIAAKDSPVEMLEFATTLEPKEMREVARKVLGVWAESDPTAALAALEEMADPQLTEMAHYRLIEAWVTSDPLAAFEWARIQPTSRHRTQALTTSLRKVAQSDPRHALALAEYLDAGARPNIIESVLLRWARVDPRAAVAWVDASRNKTDGAVAAVIGAYARLDAEEAFDWLQTQPVEARRHAAPIIVSSLAEESPEAALEMIDRIDDPTTAMSAGFQLMYRWASDNPHAAVRAITSVRGDWQPQLYLGVFTAWSDYDLEAAKASIGQVPASGRDAAIQGLLPKVLSDGDVESAERLFERIVATESRRRAATTMYFHFNRTDPKRAERYREMSELILDEDGAVLVRVPVQGL